MHEKLSSKGKDNDVEGDERDIGNAFAIVRRCLGVIANPSRDKRVVFGERITKEQRMMKRVGLGRVDTVSQEDYSNDDKWI